MMYPNLLVLFALCLSVEYDHYDTQIHSYVPVKSHYRLLLKCIHASKLYLFYSLLHRIMSHTKPHAYSLQYVTLNRLLEYILTNATNLI